MYCLSRVLKWKTEVTFSCPIITLTVNYTGTRNASLGLVVTVIQRCDLTHLLDEDHHPLLQTDQFLRHPLGLVEQHVRSAIVAIQCGLQVDQRLDPRLDQHQHRVEQPFVLQGAQVERVDRIEWMSELKGKNTDHKVVVKHKDNIRRYTTKHDTAEQTLLYSCLCGNIYICDE